MPPRCFLALRGSVAARVGILPLGLARTAPAAARPTSSRNGSSRTETTSSRASVAGGTRRSGRLGIRRQRRQPHYGAVRRPNAQFDSLDRLLALGEALGSAAASALHSTQQLTAEGRGFNPRHALAEFAYVARTPACRSASCRRIRRSRLRSSAAAASSSPGSRAAARAASRLASPVTSAAAISPRSAVSSGSGRRALPRLAFAATPSPSRRRAGRPPGAVPPSVRVPDRRSAGAALRPAAAQVFPPRALPQPTRVFSPSAPASPPIPPPIPSRLSSIRLVPNADDRRVVQPLLPCRLHDRLGLRGLPLEGIQIVLVPAAPFRSTRFAVASCIALRPVPAWLCSALP